MTTDQWEKYVEPAALAMNGGQDHAVERWGDEVRTVLAVVGPLIAEDTRERIVAAAARAVERTCTSTRTNRGDGRGCEDDHCPRHGACEEDEQ